MKIWKNFVASLLSISLFWFPINGQAADGDIFIEIYGARVSWVEKEFVGHAFFCLNLHTRSGPKEDCYGFYPENGHAAIYGPGLVRSEISYNPTRFSRVEASFRTAITEDQRREIFRLLNEWNAKKYTLTDKNCIDFVHSIAGTLGLKRPRRYMKVTPLQYVEGLVRANS